MTLRLFPALAGVNYPVKKTPNWSTDVQTSVSGKIVALSRWTYPRYSIELGYDFLRSDNAFQEYQDLVAFFNLAGGRANMFRFNDPDDNAVTNQGFGAGDGVTQAFQLTRSRGGFLFSWVDPVFYPVTAQIYANSILLTLGVDYTISTTGLVTFTVVPAVGVPLMWTGTFNWLCRFDEDSSTFEQFTFNLFENKKVLFTSEKI